MGMVEMGLRYNEVTRIMKILEHILAIKYMLYRSDTALNCDSYIRIRCVSSYYNGARTCFKNIPKSEKEWNLLEKYSKLKHVLECPYPDRCPTVHEIAKAYPSIMETGGRGG